MIKTAWRRTALAAAALLPSLVLLLIGLHLYSYSTIPDYVGRFEGGSLIVYDPEIGFVARPNAHVRWTPPVKPEGFDVYFDGRGARSDQRRQTPSRSDLVFVGCSQTWGAFLNHEETFAARLGGENLSMASYGTVQSLQMLKRNLDLKPRLVIYGFIDDHLRRNVMPCAPSVFPFCLDVSHVGFEPAAIEPPTSNGVARFNRRLQGVGLLDWLPHGLDVATARYRKAWADSHVATEEQQGRGFTLALEKMAEAARSQGATLVVLHIPTDYQPPPEILRRTTAALGLQLVDPTAAFAEHRKNGATLYLSDGHLNAAGHSVIAESLKPLVATKLSN